MEKLLQPKVFDGNPNLPTAPNDWNHWKWKFSSFLAAIDSQNPDKLAVLVNCLSTTVYEHIQDTATYNKAILILENLFNKRPNEIFSRHSLATRQQAPGETLDQYILENIKITGKIM